MSLITIYVTYKNMAEAKKVASALLKKKLIACATFFPIESMFWWKGKINKEKEVVSLLTTKSTNWNKVKSEIKKMHSYEVPCIEESEFTADKSYENWVKKVTTK